MARARMSYELRDIVRTADNHQSHFIRSFSVLRPVVFEDGEAAKVEKQLKRALKAEVSRNDLKAFRLLPPEKWCVRFIEQDTLIEKLRETKLAPTQTELLKATAAITGPLSRLMAHTPNNLQIPLDAPAAFGTNKLKNDIGFQPQGWNSIRGRNLSPDLELDQQAFDQKTSPVQMLFAESSICYAGVAQLLRGGAIYPEHTPHVSVLRNKQGMHPDQFRTIAPIVADAMPDIILGDTFMYLHTDRTNIRPFQALIRSIDPNMMIAQAA